jgi:CheY-like chemotaxis protein
MAAVLLIEDDASQRFVAAFALRKANHEVHEAADGPEGLAAARAVKPEVIVCDVMMPGMTGYEVVEALRGDPATATIPVVLLTAMSDRKHMRQGMTAGADDYLTKPYKPAELLEAVAAALAKRQSQEQAYRDSMSDRVSEALEEQKEELGRRYEDQLTREVSARWTRNLTATGDLAYPNAVLLQIDLLGRATAEAGPALPAMAKQAQQQARDTLYLFGANHVLPYGEDLMAVFADTASATTSTEMRALRAAFALLKSAPKERGMNLALFRGPVNLVAVHDALHGEKGHTLVPGESIYAVGRLRETAETSGWRIACADDLVDALADLAVPGKRVVLPSGRVAVELRPRPA